MYKSEDYQVMWYKNGCNIGIRRKFGDGTQCFGFGGKRCGLSEEIQRDFCEMVLKKLDAGETEAAVKAWADSAVLRDS